MFGKKDHKKIDFNKVNSILFTSDTILKILLVLVVLLVIYIFSNIIRDWKILGVIASILKVISPLFIGFGIAWLLDPLVTKLSKKTNRIVATLLVVLGFVIAIAIFLYLLLPAFIGQINSLVTVIPDILGFIESKTNTFFESMSNIISYDLSFAKDNLFNRITEFSDTLVTNLPSTIFDVVKGIVSGGINIFFGFVIGLYMLIDFRNIRKYLLTFISKKHHSVVIEYTNILNKSLYDFVKGTLLIGGILFVLQSFSFTVIGLKAPLVFGLFCAITNIIPYVGPWIGGIPAIIVAFSISPITGVLAVVAVFIAQSVENYILQPLVMGKTMNLHPVTIMVGLLIFGNYFGILGMLFATPIISGVKLTIKYFDDKYKIKETFLSDI